MRKLLSSLSLLSLLSLLNSDVLEAQKPDTALLKYKVSPKEGTMSIREKDKWKTFMLEDILDKKVHTKGIAASRFGGEREIKLEKEPLMKRLEAPSALIKELPAEFKQRVDRMVKEIKTEQREVEFDTLKPKTKISTEMEALLPVSLSVEGKEKEAMKVAAIKALAVVKTESAVFYLKESLKDERPEIKKAAAEALAKIGEPTGLEALHAGLKEESVPARVEAIKALGRVGRVTSIPPLRELLGSEEKKVSREVAMALARMGDEKGITVLHGLLISGTPDDLLEAAIVLAEIEDPAGLDVLKGNLKGVRPEVKVKVVRALGIIGDKSIIPLLEDVMRRDPDSGVRIVASESILSIKRRGR